MFGNELLVGYCNYFLLLRKHKHSAGWLLQLFLAKEVLAFSLFDLSFGQYISAMDVDRMLRLSPLFSLSFIDYV